LLAKGGEKMKNIVILMILAVVILTNTTDVFAHWRTPEELIIQDPIPKIFKDNNIK